MRFHERGELNNLQKLDEKKQEQIIFQGKIKTAKWEHFAAETQGDSKNVSMKCGIQAKRKERDTCERFVYWQAGFAVTMKKDSIW